MGKLSFGDYRTQWPRVGGVMALALGGASTLLADRVSRPRLFSVLNFGVTLADRTTPYAFTERQMGPYGKS